MKVSSQTCVVASDVVEVSNKTVQLLHVSGLSPDEIKEENKIFHSLAIHQTNQWMASRHSFSKAIWTKWLRKLDNFWTLKWYSVRGRINHNAGRLGKVPRAKGKKWSKVGLKREKMREKGPMNVKMKEIDPQKNFSPQISKKFLGLTRALIRPW
jgi:hypothetical protein